MPLSGKLPFRRPTFDARMTPSLRASATLVPLKAIPARFANFIPQLFQRGRALERFGQDPRLAAS